MKSNTTAFVSMLCAAILFGGCTPKSIPEQEPMTVEVYMAEPAVEEKAMTIEMPFGAYVIPAGWYEYPELSGMTGGANETARFYAVGVPEDGLVTNICVEYARNQYAAINNERFQQDKMDSLEAAKEYSDQIESVRGDRGSSTDQGYICYTFEIVGSGVTTTQFFIVGDRQDVLVQLTDLHDPNVTNGKEVARQIVDSFVWNEEFAAAANAYDPKGFMRQLLGTFMLESIFGHSDDYFDENDIDRSAMEDQILSDIYQMVEEAKIEEIAVPSASAPGEYDFKLNEFDWALHRMYTDVDDNVIGYTFIEDSTPSKDEDMIHLINAICFTFEPNMELDIMKEKVVKAIDDAESGMPGMIELENTFIVIIVADGTTVVMAVSTEMSENYSNWLATQ